MVGSVELSVAVRPIWNDILYFGTWIDIYFYVDLSRALPDAFPPDPPSLLLFAPINSVWWSRFHASALGTFGDVTNKDGQLTPEADQIKVISGILNLQSEMNRVMMLMNRWIADFFDRLHNQLIVNKSCACMGFSRLSIFALLVAQSYHERVFWSS